MNQRNRKVLLVEDNSETRELLTNLLRSWGYTVEAVSDGLEALDAARKHPPPCAVLLDLLLPVMSGWEVAAELRKRENLSRVPVVVVSGCVGEKDSMLPPAHAHLAKPIDVGSLRRILGEICSEPVPA
jgi:two-component system response regulator (stage 0 sporulation protein F)